MSINIDMWRAAMLSRGTPKPRMVLMSEEYLYDEGVTRYTRVTGANYWPHADSWFTVPEPLAQAYEAAIATVEYLEAHLEAHIQKSGHRKYMARNYDRG